MSKARERAYERRRYEEWQVKLAERRQRRLKARRIAIAAISSVAAIGVIGGISYLVISSNNSSTSTATAASATPTPASTAAATPSVAAATPVAGGCTPSTLGAVKNPQQISKVPSKSIAAGANWNATFTTTCGTIEMQLDGKKAPQAVSATIALIRAGFYDKTPCHRLTTSGIFVLQCGDPTGTGSGSPGFSYGPLENIPKDGLYPPGTVAIARGQAQDSQGSQFFLVYANTSLPAASTGGGYTIVGKITKGLDVVKKVAKSGAVAGANGPGDGAPVTPISILTAKVSKG